TVHCLVNKHELGLPIFCSTVAKDAEFLGIPYRYILIGNSQKLADLDPSSMSRLDSELPQSAGGVRPISKPFLDRGIVREPVRQRRSDTPVVEREPAASREDLARPCVADHLGPCGQFRHRN